MPTRRLVALFVAILLALAIRETLAQADPFTGTFTDGKLTLTLAPAGGGYAGSVTLGGNVYPLTGMLVDKKLTGTFTSGNDSFPFTASFGGGGGMLFKSESASYILAKKAAGDPAKPETTKPDPAKPETKPRPNTPAPPTPQPEMLPPEAAPVDKPDHAKVEAAIAKGKAFLLAQQKNGNWDIPARAKEPVAVNGAINVMDVQNSTQWGGLSALATYALLASGESLNSPPMAAAIDWLKKNSEMNGTYALAMRALVWNAVPNGRKKDFLDMAKRERDLLMKNKRANDEYRGMFRYLPTDSGYDHSASQIAVLGMWACDQMGAEVPSEFWKEVETSWTKFQDPSGAWGYGKLFTPRPPVTPAMTAAGIATLFITTDMLHGNEGIDCKGNISNKAIDAGLKWITQHYDEVGHGQWPFYTLYGIERIGLASGYKYLGAFDWYKHGANKLLATQQPDGSWGASVSDTAFAVLFLVRGRNPVLMNKLQYTLDTNGDRRESNWNQRPRDCANVTKWVGRQLERDLNWQIVTLKGSVDDLHDAPILYISGNQQLNISAEDQQKLRTYVLQGGMIVGHADCSNPAFATSFEKLGTKLFGYEFRDLPPGHIIYNTLFDRKRWKGVTAVQGMSNGARELMVMLSAGDPGRFWQTGAVGGHENAYELMANLFMYVTERRDLRFKGDSWIAYPKPDAAPAARHVRLARLDFGSNSNPEPGGWVRLTTVLRNEGQMSLVVEPVKLGEGQLGGFKIAHLTSGAKFKFTDPQKAELKSFIEGGGTLIADAAGGNGEAASALETELAAIAPAKPEILPADHPAYAALGIPAADIAYRAFAAKQLGQAKCPRVRAIAVNKRPAIFYSPEDLSVGLVGQPVDGIVGYTPASATAIVRSLLTFAGGKE